MSDKSIGKITEQTHLVIANAEDELINHFAKQAAYYMRLNGEIHDLNELESVDLSSLIGDSVLLFIINTICRNAVRKRLDPLHTTYDKWVVDRVEGGQAGQYRTEEIINVALEKLGDITNKVESIKNDLKANGITGILQDYLRSNMFIS